MVSLAEIVFWGSFGLIAYTYVVYPVLLWLLSQVQTWIGPYSQSSHALIEDELPAVGVIVAAHNEEKHIRKRILNLLDQDYPQEKLRVYVGSDGSTDRTVDIVRDLRSSRVSLYTFTQRRGKASILNDLVANANESILVFTDANTEFAREAITRLVGHFHDEAVGVVCGELSIVADPEQNNQDHVYWRYEQWLKSHEGRVGGLLGANGGIYAIRRQVFRPLPADTIVDDFMISMEAYRAGYRVLYDREALAYEEAAPNLQVEYQRRVRIGIGNYQAFSTLLHLLSPFRGTIFFTYFSHKVIRWFVPHLLLAALVASLTLWAHPFYRALSVLQLAGYAYVAITYRLMSRLRLPRLLQMPTYVVALNAALLVGFAKFVTRQYGGTWKRTTR